MVLAMLAVGAEARGIKGPAVSDLAEYLTGPAHVAGRGVLKHEQVKLVPRLIAVGRKACFGSLQLAAQRLPAGGQVGKAAAGKLRLFIDALKVARLRSPRSEARRVGKECVSRDNSWWYAAHFKKT